MQFQYLHTGFLLKSSLFLIAAKENFFLTSFLYFRWITLLKFTSDNFLRSPIKTRKNMTGAQASVHFENEQNVKNAHENEKNV